MSLPRDTRIQHIFKKSSESSEVSYTSHNSYELEITAGPYNCTLVYDRGQSLEPATTGEEQRRRSVQQCCQVDGNHMQLMLVVHSRHSGSSDFDGDGIAGATASSHCVNSDHI